MLARGDQIDDLLNSLIGFVVRRLNLGGQRSRVRGPVMKERVGQGAADTFMEQDEQGRHFHAFVGEPVTVPRAVALAEAVRSELPHVVAKLSDGIGVWG